MMVNLHGLEVLLEALRGASAGKDEVIHEGQAKIHRRRTK
jgi:hypothetical protein